MAAATTVVCVCHAWARELRLVSRLWVPVAGHMRVVQVHLLLF